MPHGTPDWGQLSATTQRYPVTDLGELAARLGALPSIDRRGDVVFTDSFESGLVGWLYVALGTGAQVGLSMGTAHTGLFSARLEPGDAAGGYAAIFRRMPLPATALAGVEFWLYVGEAFDTLVLAVYRYTGSEQTTWALRYDDQNNTIDYWGAAGAWVTVATDVDLFGNGGQWNALKLVFDQVEQKYVRAIVNDSEYSLAGVAGQQVASGTAEHMELSIYCYAQGGGSPRAHIDDVILTENESA